MLECRMTVEEQLDTLCRGCTEVISREDLAEKLKLGRSLKVKLGVDPTVPHVTLGWGVVLRKLRHFQDLGHQACLIIGDFTAQIGDPSGKSKTRPQLTREQVVSNVKMVETQLFKILEPSKTTVYYNADWLDAMRFSDVVRLASKITVARILERDDFQNRLSDEKPIGLHEVLYPLCQAYDSVAIEADVELGGTDQKFNNLTGRNLQREYGQAPQVVMLMPLLVGTDGVEKMSQSLGNFVSVVDEPNDMYGKTMSIPDHLIESWFTLCTDVPLSEVAETVVGIANGALNPRDAKQRLAQELVRMYHSEEAAQSAHEYFVRTFSKREKPVDAPEATIPDSCIRDGKISIPHLLKALGLSESNSSARRLMEGGGVSLGDDLLTNPVELVAVDDAIGKVLRAGRHRFRTLTR